MARRILIVEDNEGVGLLLEEIVRALDAEPVRVKGGSEALARLQPLPAAAVVDLVLADLDGFQVAKALRALPGGAEVPLLTVSGVYRKLPDAFVESAKPRHFAKPFDPNAFKAALADVLQTQDAAAGVMRGRFVRSSPAALFVELLEKRATGVLEVVHGEVKRRLYFQQGHLRFGQSNVRTESAGGMQVARKTLGQAPFEQAVQHAKTARVPLHEALVATGAMTREQAQEALRAQTAAVAEGVLSMLGADWTFGAAEVEKQPDTRRHPLAAILEAAKRDLSPAEAREALMRAAPARLTKSPLLERELFVVRSAWPNEGVTALLAGGTTAQELAQRGKPEELPLAWALVSSGLVRQEGAPAAVTPGAASEAPVDLDAGKRFTPEAEALRSAIFSERERAETLNHYELLGVAPKAPTEEIRRAYLELARRYHTDSHAGIELGSARQAVDHLFQRVNEAMETLGDEKRRAEYDIYLDRKAQGLPTDVSAILRAEDLFQRGEVMLRGNKAQEALALFREAVALNHAEAEFHAYLGYALYRVHGAPSLEEARAHLAKSLEMTPNLASAHYLLGLIARDQGELAEAERRLAKALELDPKNDPAARELRYLRQRREKAEGQKSGLFGRLFKK